jgi:chromate reductase, NAD(P)H dehydrogenase (quinone)
VPGRLLLISGSLRAQSTNTAVVLTARGLVPGGYEATVFDGLGRLPHYNPDLDTQPLEANVTRLRSEIHRADAIVFSTPEYAGALPGSFKNLLDWTIGDDRPGSIYEKPVAWINASPRGADQAHDELRRVFGYAHATVVAEACADIPVTAAMVDEQGLIADADTRARIAGALDRLTAGLESLGAATPSLPSSGNGRLP